MARGLERFGVRSEVLVGAGLAGRARAIQAVLRRRPQVVVLQKLFYGRIELAVLRRLARHIVLECDDAVHLGYPSQSRRETMRLRRRVDLVLRAADLVTTSNPLLAVELTPASGQSLWYAGPAPAVASPIAERQKVALWLGSPSTSTHLRLLDDVPRLLGPEGWRFVAVGATDDAASSGWEVVTWTMATAEEWLARAAVGVMPQASTPWDDRKAAYKVLQYMSAGVIPIASDVPPARTLLAGTALDSLLVRNGEWNTAITRGWDERQRWQPSLRDLADRFSLDRCSKQWFDRIDGLAA
jgi:glycosyltransferase involved in cell wall biosynthesis